MDLIERLRVRNIPYGWLELADKAAAALEAKDALILRAERAVDAAQAEIERLQVRAVNAENSIRNQFNTIDGLRAEIERLKHALEAAVIARMGG